MVSARYKVIGMHARHGGQTIVTGLPTAAVDNTLLWVVGMFCVIAVLALVGAGPLRASGSFVANWLRSQGFPLRPARSPTSSLTRARCVCRR